MKTGRITQVLKAMTLEDVRLNKRNNQIMCFGNQDEYTVRIATTKEQLQQAYQLTYQTYLEKGYVTEQASKMWIPQWENKSESVILIVLKNETAVGTLTAAFDASSRLPADSIYQEELNELRHQDQRLAEVMSLSLLPNMKDSKIILNNLINALFILCKNIKQVDRLIITVNPRHTAFYIKKVLFKDSGICKSYKKVKGAPAVLLTLDFKDYFNSLSQHRLGNKPDRTIFKFFANKQKENIIQKILTKQFNKISRNPIVTAKIP